MDEFIKSLKIPLFASRDTIEEAYQYAQMVANGTDNPPAVMTAVQVVVNTIAQELEKITAQEQSPATDPMKMLEDIVHGWRRV